MEFRKITLGPVVFGDPRRFVLIAGPCVIESEKHTLMLASKIQAIAKAAGVPFVFKASFDKANRSSVDSFRGPGIHKGLEILDRVKRELKVPVLSDIHEAEQAAAAGDVLDIIQIPAFLCRQTDLLIAAAKTGRVVNVKKGQFLAPEDTKNIITKLESAGCRKILLTERGVSFGYKNLVNDFRSIPLMRSFGCPVVYDATHSVQLPGGQGKSSGGQAEFIPVLARCGVVAGADALFMEVHDRPRRALSDGANALELGKLQALLEILKPLRRFAPGAGEVTR
ncbi:MAG: 3-deoxy-8-phosphooctulonate synthase [Candidatus Omnitrophota bacterium]